MSEPALAPEVRIVDGEFVLKADLDHDLVASSATRDTTCELAIQTEEPDLRWGLLKYLVPLEDGEEADNRFFLWRFLFPTVPANIFEAPPLNPIRAKMMALDIKIPSPYTVVFGLVFGFFLKMINKATIPMTRNEYELAIIQIFFSGCIVFALSKFGFIPFKLSSLSPYNSIIAFAVLVYANKDHIPPGQRFVDHDYILMRAGFCRFICMWFWADLLDADWAGALFLFLDLLLLQYFPVAYPDH